MLRQLIQGYGSVSIIGMCKNAGKTTVLNSIIREFSGTRLGLTSIGRDGESVDVVTNTHKPGIYVECGTLIATARDMLKLCDITREILATTGINTPLGEVALVRARSDGAVQLAGPSMTEQLAGVVGSLAGFGAELVLVDGALSRKSLCAPAVSEATVLCTGASYHSDMAVVAADVGFAARLLTLEKTGAWQSAELERPEKVLLKGGGGPVYGAATLADALRERQAAGVTHVFVNGALTDSMLTPLLTGGVELKGRELAVKDGSRLLISRGVFEKLKIRGAKLAVLNATRLAAVTVNPKSAYGLDMDGAELVARVSGVVDAPVLDVCAGVGGGI